MYILDTDFVYQTNASLRLFSIYQVCAVGVTGIVYTCSLQRCLRLDVDGGVAVVPDTISKAHSIASTYIITE